MARNNQQVDIFPQIRIASPCTVDWNAMQGDDRARHCDHCRKNVYNFSDMSRAEAEAFIREKEGDLCVRFYRRRDGTILTNDCPVGLRRVRRWLVTQLATTGAAFGIIAILAPFVSADRIKKSQAFQAFRNSDWAQREPLRGFLDRVDPQPPQNVIMGMIAMPPPRRAAGKPNSAG